MVLECLHLGHDWAKRWYSVHGAYGYVTWFLQRIRFFNRFQYNYVGPFPCPRDPNSENLEVPITYWQLLALDHPRFMEIYRWFSHGMPLFTGDFLWDFPIVWWHPDSTAMDFQGTRPFWALAARRSTWGMILLVWEHGVNRNQHDSNNSW